jgi:DNA-binding NarL/FixJ family response regulator
VLVHTVDLTGRKRTEEMLRSARADLEKRVEERTEELAHANEALRAEQLALEQKNVALQEVLNQIEKGKEELASQIQLNIDRVTLPLLNTLEQGVSEPRQRLVSLLRTSLMDVTLPFISSLEARFPRLTPRELEICQMVKAGLSCKDISATLVISEQTVLKHRAVIRKKLGISHQRMNLVSFLRTLK